MVLYIPHPYSPHSSIATLFVVFELLLLLLQVPMFNTDQKVLYQRARLKMVWLQVLIASWFISVYGSPLPPPQDQCKPVNSHQPPECPNHIGPPCRMCLYLFFNTLVTKAWE